ncbi:hypothetical protein CLOM_g8229 [Closterium sp. NIES-68]|nr:hypothetical protein CLOM_g8229 [Closterium sp. NIES-68]
MKHILRPLLDECMVMYPEDILIYSRNMKEQVEHLRRVLFLDDILIYSHDMKQRVEHLQRVFDIIRQERCYVKLSNSEFALKNVQFQRHIVSAQDVHVGPRRLKPYARGKHPRTRRTEIRPLVLHMSTDEEQQTEIAGLLQPLPVPEQPWQVVSLDYITELPTTTSGHDAILVVIDKISKMGHFISIRTTARTAETAQLFVRYIISQHGIPTTLISDRDPKFTRKFWK